ncbi:MAG: hypothetical protein WDO68_03790 [Gammaproteobacteria bacterium]
MTPVDTGALNVRALVELRGMADLLCDDLARHTKEAKLEEWARREYVRSLFAMLEGLTYGLKQAAVVFAKTLLVELAPEEQALIEESAYELNERGDVGKRRLHLRLLPSLQFAFKIYVKAARIAFELPVHESGWEKLRRVRDVRDRLTHPKSVADLGVSDEEFAISEEVSAWFSTHFEECLWLACVGLLASLDDFKAKLDDRDQLPRGPSGGYSAKGMQDLSARSLSSPSSEKRAAAEALLQKVRARVDVQRSGR